MENDTDLLRAVTSSLTQSEEWRNVLLLLGRLGTEEARLTVDTMDMLVEHFERLCEEKPKWN